MKKKQKYVEVEVDFDDITFMRLAKMAHDRDITLNQLCVELLESEMKKDSKKFRNKLKKAIKKLKKDERNEI